MYWATSRVSLPHERDGTVAWRFETDTSPIAVDGTRVAAVEEPVAYHDQDAVRGSYRLHVQRGD